MKERKSFLVCKNYTRNFNEMFLGAHLRRTAVTRYNLNLFHFTESRSTVQTGFVVSVLCLAVANTTENSLDVSTPGRSKQKRNICFDCC